MDTKRIIGILLILAMLIISLSSCTNLEPSEQEMKVIGKSVYTASDGTVTEFEITFDTLRYFTLNYISTLGDKYKGSDSNPQLKAEYEADIRNYLDSTINRNYAIMKLCNDFGVDYNAEAILEKVQDYVDDTIEECGGIKGYAESLKEQYMTDRFYREYISLQYAINELTFVFSDDLELIPDSNEEIMDYLMGDDFIHTRHICIYKDGVDDNANRQKIEMIYEKLKNKKADFEQLIGEYSEDYQDTGKGYYFTKGEYEKPYEEAAFSLKDEEYSGIIELSSGYYIIKRYAKGKSDKDYFEANIEAFAQQIQYALTYNKVMEIQDEMVFELNDYGSSIVLSEIGKIKVD